MSHSPRPQIEDIELEMLLTSVERLYGYDYRDYAPAFVKRRMNWLMHELHLDNFSVLQAKLLREPRLFARMATSLSVGSTSMFRDPLFFQTLRHRVLPTLKTWPFVRIWHAGCSSGEEVYSMAILLHEAGLLHKSRIYATDINGEFLSRARSGIFPLHQMQDFAMAYHSAGGPYDLARYYVADHKNAIFREELRNHIIFSRHNLAQDKVFNEFHMVFCRNVLIYFNDDLRHRVYALLRDSLIRFGFLALGQKETLRFGTKTYQFDTLDESVSLYRAI